MEIILRQDYESLGAAGEIVNVKDGFGRNFLIPRGIAYIATDANKKRHESDLKQASMQLARDKKAAEELSEKLKNVSCTITVQVGEEDKLFGSVTSLNITESLSSQGFDIDKRKILLEEPIKSLGIYSVPIKLHPEVECNVKVWVVKE